jgi:hypothetical protein
MAVKHAYYCVICHKTLGHLWMGQRHKIPDFFCMEHFFEHCLDEQGGFIPMKEWPDWLRFLWNEENARRVRKLYWERRGFEFEPIPLSQLSISYHHDDRHDHDEIDALEEMGHTIIS